MKYVCQNKYSKWTLYVLSQLQRTLGFFLWRRSVGFWSFSDPGPQQSHYLLNQEAWSKSLGSCPSNSTGKSGHLLCLTIWAPITHLSGKPSWKATKKCKFCRECLCFWILLSIINSNVKIHCKKPVAFS